MRSRTLTLLGLSAVLVFISATPALAAPKLKTLDEAVAYVKQLNTQGMPRQEIAAEVTKIVDSRVYNVNSWERVTKWPNYMPFGSYFSKDEENFDKFRAKENSFDNDVAARYAWDSQYGQCEECASLSYYLLKQAGVDGNVRIFASTAGSSGHNFVVWGLKDGADPNDPSTWGDDAYVVDGWQGKTLDKDAAAADKYVSNGGEAKVADRTKAHDKTATVWNTDSSSSTYTGDDCLMEFLFGEAPGGDNALALARALRDRVLARSATGRTMITTYYSVSSWAMTNMFDPDSRTAQNPQRDDLETAQR
ncbi:MAG: hypothetical protein JXE06_06295 [Coriobacteriia bacterium]|nr:hypothetical protein [Coriobacteriia bacterium]MBN2821987.1 hypothetical protein [Coriobacteriia bacterium]